MAGKGSFTKTVISRCLLVVLISAGNSLACSPRIISYDPANTTSSPMPLATSAELYVGMQANPNSRVYHYHLDYTAPVESVVSYVANTGNLLSVAGNSIRSLILLASDNIIAGSWNSPVADIVSSTMAIQGSLSFSGGGSNAISGVHAGCVLPNGNVIIGDQYNSHANNINEYTVSGAFVRSVYQPSQALGISNPYPGMTNCVAVSASNIIMVIADTWTIQNTKAIQLTLSEGSWNVTHQFSMTNFDTLQGTSGSSIWSLALGRDGYVYFPPMRRATGQLQKLIKCPSSDITENKCELVGDIIPESTLNSSNYTTFTYAVVQIPDTDDLLVALYYRLYRYNAASGAYMLVHSFSDELPIDTFAPRAMVIR